MGLLRLYITLIIAVGHMHTWYGFSFPWLAMLWSGGLMGMARVHVYFIESGFLTQCQFIRPEFRKNHPPALYYRRRLTRIYPQYLAFLLLTLMAQVAFQDPVYLETMQRKGTGMAEAIVANLLALNLPTLELWHMDMGQASGYLMMPQAFTLTLQFGFILLAPWVLASGRRLWMAAALCSAMMLYYYAFTSLSRNFFVTELAYFWFGALAARLMLRFEARMDRTMALRLAAIFLAPTVIAALWYAPFEKAVGEWPAYALYNVWLTATMIPAYLLSRGSALDRFCSQVTYSLYLCHMLIAYVVHKLFFPAPYCGMLALSLSLALAVAISFGSAVYRKKIVPRLVTG